MDGGATEIGGVESVENLGRLERWWNIPSIIIWSLILFGSFLLNATLLLAFLKRPGLRTISNRFVMNLTASNLLTVVMINSLLIFDKQKSTSGHCSLAEGATAFVTSSSIFSVLLIALDQYLAVVDPLRYRTRIDKLKCIILILTTWIVSILFSLIAVLNPSPKSLWLACSVDKNVSTTVTQENSTLDLKILIETQKNNSNPLIEINEKIAFISNQTKNFNPTIFDNFNDNDNLFIITYGFIYTMTSGIIVYLLPFISVCWIYINIYLAAHKNSERTRRNGSRPILSTGSFTEDYYCPIRHDMADEIRRIPKISSLSSIDESIETVTSQLPIQRSNLNDISSNNGNDTTKVNGGAVIFTVGDGKVNAKKREQQSNAKDNVKIPIAVLKRQFLSSKNQQQQQQQQQHHQTFNDCNEQQCKSSHDLMYDDMILQNNFLRLRTDNFISDSSESDDENEIIKRNDENDLRYPPLMTKNEFNDKVRDEEMIEDFKQKVQNSYSNRENNLLNKHDGQSNDNNSNHPTPIVTITPPNKIPLRRVSSTRSTASYINCLKHRISNASLFKYREETRAARISALVIVMGFICWTPYFIISILKNISVYFQDKIPHEFDIAAMSFLILATYITPLLFGYRSRRVKRELRKFFCFKRELSYKNNRSLMAKKVLKRRHSGNLSHLEMDNRYNIFNCVYGRNKWPKEKVQFVQVPDTALAVETCRSSFSSGASTQVSSTSTDEN